MSPRIAPAEPPFLPEIQQKLDAIMPEGVPPLTLFTTLARSPRVFSRVMAAGLLDRGPLSLRQREIMIDRTSARLDNEYEWGVHVAFFGARVGFDEAMTRALARGAWDDAAFAPEERAIVRLADELHDSARISPQAWALVSEHFNAAQILELMALAGFYRTIAYFCCGLELAPEAFAAPL